MHWPISLPHNTALQDTAAWPPPPRPLPSLAPTTQTSPQPGPHHPDLSPALGRQRFITGEAGGVLARMASRSWSDTLLGKSWMLKLKVILLAHFYLFPPPHNFHIYGLVKYQAGEDLEIRRGDFFACLTSKDSFWYSCNFKLDIVTIRKFRPYGGLLSSFCGGLKGPSCPKVILADKRKNERTNGRTDERTNGRTDERTDKQTVERTDERTDECQWQCAKLAPLLMEIFG